MRAERAGAPLGSSADHPRVGKMAHEDSVAPEWVHIVTDEITDSESVIQHITHPRGQGERAVPRHLFSGEWNGYILELFGIVPDHFPADDTEWPWWRFDDFVVQARWQAAYRPGAPLRATVMWHPGDSVRKSIEVMHDDWQDSDLTDAARAMRLLHGKTHGGRRRLEEEPWPYWREQADRAIGLKRQRYTWPDIRRRTGIPEGTIRRWVKRRQRELEK
jgi:hypothetical protein